MRNFDAEIRTDSISPSGKRSDGVKDSPGKIHNARYSVDTHCARWPSHSANSTLQHSTVQTPRDHPSLLKMRFLNNFQMKCVFLGSHVIISGFPGLSARGESLAESRNIRPSNFGRFATGLFARMFVRTCLENLKNLQNEGSKRFVSSKEHVWSADSGSLEATRFDRNSGY